MQNNLDLSEVLPADLARLFDLIADRSNLTGSRWHEKEYAGILNHLLASPLLIVAGDAESSDSAGPHEDHGTVVATLQAALFAEHPDVEVLQLIKQYAKREYRAGSSSLPRPVSLMLYYLAICVALCRTRHCITELDQADLAEGVSWALNESWIGDPIRTVFESAQTRLPAA